MNLMLADKAGTGTASCRFDIFNFDGFLGDVMTANWRTSRTSSRAPQYRFRILNAASSRFFKIALQRLGQAQPITQIANDGNLLPSPVTLTALDEQGIAERYDIVIDFSQLRSATSCTSSTSCEHDDGAKPRKDLSMARGALGRLATIRASEVPRVPHRARTRRSRTTAWCPAVMIPNPDLSHDSSRARTHVRVRHAAASRQASRRDAAAKALGHQHRRGSKLDADYGRVSAAPKFGHPRSVAPHQRRRRLGPPHPHPLRRGADPGAQRQRRERAAWERGRKDVYRLQPGRHA